MKELKKFLVSLSILLLISGCASEPIIKTEYVYQQIPIKAPPKPIQTLPVKFVVVTNENKDSSLERLSGGSSEYSAYCITPKTYQNMAYNLAEAIRYIKEQKAIISYYETTIKNGNKKSEN